jgi:hypothetical protein
MKIIRNAIAAGLIAAASVAACSSQHGATSTGTASNTGPNVGTNGQAGGVGEVAMAWQVATGINVTDLKYTITGSGTTAGNNYGPLDANIGDAMSAEWVAGGITAGCGYTLSVSGVDSNNDPCSGTTGTFCVVPGQTTYEQISVVCLEPTDGQVAADVNTGSVAVEAGITAVPVAPYTCPGITSFSIVPAELLSSQPAMVSIQTTGTVSAIQWTTSACMNSPGQGPGTGTPTGFTNPTAASTTFSCGSCQGQVTIQAQVQYDQVEPGQDAGTNVCAGAQFTTFTGLINCEGGGTVVCFAPQVACNGVCTNPNTDNKNCGTCNNACAAPTTCNSGACNCGTGETLSDGICCANATPTSCNGTSCTNLQTDNSNCGTCGNACTANQVCSAGKCGAVPPTACNSSPCAANTLPCDGNTGGIEPAGECTKTEQVFVNRDIAAGNYNATTLKLNPYNQTTKTGSCYECMVFNDCIDDDTNGDTGKECGDVTVAATDGEPGPQECLDTLSCINSSMCDTANPPSACFCGTASGSACLTAGAANGPCINLEIDGIGVGTCSNTYNAAAPNQETAKTCTEGDPTASSKAYSNVALPAGNANAFMGCAVSNCKTLCTP